MIATSLHGVPKAERVDNLRERLRAQRKFLPFCKYVDPRHPIDALHIQYMAHKLEQVKLYIESKGQQGIGRLMLFMPPRYWKSQTASRKFPAWLLGQMPDLRIILTSYGADLATKHSKAVRDLIMTDRYSTVFGEMASNDEPVLLDAESRSSASWDLAGRSGGMQAAGINGALTGFGANLLIIDDPIKNRDEATMANFEKAVDFYQSTAYTRLEDFAAVIQIMTRWHQKDLPGEMLRLMATDADADQWEVAMMPAIALEEKQYPKTQEEFLENLSNGIFIPKDGDQLGRKPGEPLWRKKHDETDLRKISANTSLFEFTSLFQQMPFSKEGQRYKREWFKKVTKLPEGVKILYAVRYWDKANSIAGDYTAGVLMAYCSDGFFYILDVKRKKATSYERDLMMQKTAAEDRENYGNLVKGWHQQDPGSAGKDSAEATNQKMMGFNYRFEPVTGSKEDRSDPLESAFQGGLIFLLLGGWNGEFIDEGVSFPRGANDDQIDAASSCYSKLLTMIRKPTKEVKSYQG